VGVLGVVAACGEEEAERYDPDEVIAAAVNFSDYERMDLERQPTGHKDLTASMSIWANEPAAEIFRTLDPLDLDQEAEFPPGAVLVKEMYTLDGEPTPELFVLAKFEAGYNDRANDWFFARISREGEVLDGISGKGGEVEFCADCHSSMGGNSDFVIGLPAENQR